MSATVHHGAEKSTRRRQRALWSLDRSDPCVAFVGFVRGSPSLDRSHGFSAFSWTGGDHVDRHDFVVGLAPSRGREKWVRERCRFWPNLSAVGFGDRLMPAGDMARCVYHARRRVGRDNCPSVSCTLSRRISMHASFFRPSREVECVAELWNLIP